MKSKKTSPSKPDGFYPFYWRWDSQGKIFVYIGDSKIKRIVLDNLECVHFTSHGSILIPPPWKKFNSEEIIVMQEQLETALCKAYDYLETFHGYILTERPV